MSLFASSQVFVDDQAVLYGSLPKAKKTWYKARSG
jgi:hypothetical protein